VQQALLLLSSSSHMCLLRPVSAEIKEKFRYFSRLVLDVWVLDDYLDIFSDNHHVNHEKEAASTLESLLLNCITSFNELNAAYHWPHDNLQGFAA